MSIYSYMWNMQEKNKLYKTLLYGTNLEMVRMNAKISGFHNTECKQKPYKTVFM